MINDDGVYTFDGPAGFVIVPNFVRDAINRKLDEKIAEEPAAAKDREYLYTRLIAYFSEYGEIPEFELKRAAP